MSLIPLLYAPGVCKVDSTYAAGKMARYIDMDKARFVDGFPEKIGGWTTLDSSAVTGIPRGLAPWRDNNQNIRLAVGTHKKLYYYYAATLNDITPWRWILTGTLTNPFTTTSSSTTVTVAHTAHGLSSNDMVQLVGGSAVGGLTIAGVFSITKVDANSYTITASSAATSGATGGGSTSYKYPRVTLTSPFATTNGSTTVTVTHNAHGAVDGDYVTFASATAVGGVTIDGEYAVSNVGHNTYDIAVASAATSTATGGGSPTVEYDINIGLSDSAFTAGWGTGTFGSGSWGVSANATYWLLARTWSLYAYGQQLYACPANGTIYVWDPTLGGRAYPLYGAPSSLIWMFITQERFVIALGANSDALTIAWPDQNDTTIWTASTTNTANDGRKLQGGSLLVGGLPVRAGVSLIFTNTTCFLHQYTGDDFVFETRAIAEGAGLAGPLAATVMNGKAFWISDANFWVYDGTARPLPSLDIRDYVFGNLNTQQATKFVAAANRAKSEVWFFYCSSSATEIDSYVIWHDDQQVWSVGTLERTCWVDRSLIAYPVACDSTGLIYEHEFGVDANGTAMDSYITAAPQDIADGDANMDIFGLIPDIKSLVGDVSLTVLTRNYPNDTDVESGPYTVSDDNAAPLIGVRANGKMAGYKLESDTVGGSWRLGIPRADAQPSGVRR